MSELNTVTAASGAAPASRRRGAPLGNRNAMTHGRRTAEARNARAAARARVDRRLVELAKGFRQPAQRGDPLPRFLRTKQNNSVADIGPTAQQKKRGAPKGNGNALKHGLRSAEMTRLRREMRLVIAKMRFLTKLAHEFVLLRAMERKAAKRKSTSSRIDEDFPFSETLASLTQSENYAAKFLQDEPGPDG